MSKKEPWQRPRHKFTFKIAGLILRHKMLKVYNAKIDDFKEVGDRNWLVLANHQTDFDQFFIAKAFNRPLYFVAMEDIFSNGFLSKVLKWGLAPIPFKKASKDVRAVMNCLRIAKEGGSIALFPEGNRTYSGKTCYIKDSVAPLIKKLGLPVAFYKIEGGYGVKPRWADDIRDGQMHVRLARIVEPEEYKDLSNEEIYDMVCKELALDESQNGGEYYSSKAAEGLEKVLYVCPECGLTQYKTEGEILTCTKCGRQYKYLPSKKFEAINCEHRFDSVADWYDYQEDFIRHLDLSPYYNQAVYTDIANISEVIVYQRKQKIKKNATISIYADRLEIEGFSVFNYDDILAMGCVADHKLNIFYKDKIYQIKGDRSFNALKYCNIYYHAQFVKEGHSDGEFQFLGL